MSCQSRRPASDGGAVAKPKAVIIRDFGQELANFGYPAFLYLKNGEPRLSPAQFLLRALARDNLSIVVCEGLPWIALAYCEMDWKWLYEQAQLNGLQNRLGFTVLLARNRAVLLQQPAIAAHLSSVLEFMVPLDKEGTYCREDMTQAERKWLRAHRSKEAAAWNILSGIDAENLEYGEVPRW